MQQPQDQADQAARRTAQIPAVPQGAPLSVAGDGLAALAERIAASAPALFLDYDGTLTPIVARPELAVLDPAMRERLRRLAALCPVAIVSGRDLADLRARVGLDGLLFAGSHGFDIDAPSGGRQFGLEYRPALEAAGDRLRRDLAGITGALIEAKAFAVAVHTRGVADEAAKARVRAAVEATHAEAGRLRLTFGKEVLELRPDLDWDKGHAVLSLIEAERMGGRLPVYVGDDLTDEDAFRALKGRAEGGLGLQVGDHGQPTDATHRLPDIASLGGLLDALAAALERRREG